MASQPALNSDGQLIEQSSCSTAEHDWDDVPFPLPHADEGNRAQDKSKPIEQSARWKERMQPKPDRKIQYHPDNSCRHGGESGGESSVAAQLLDIRSTQEYPKKLRN